MSHVTVVAQNMTEGPVTQAIREGDAFIGCETDKAKVRNGLGNGWGFYLPQDVHQLLAWRESVFAEDGEGKSTKLHDSTGSPSIPDAIRTPVRWVHEQPLVHKETGVPVTLMGTWLINSWKPASAAGRDQWTDDRAKLARQSLAIIAERTAKVKEKKRVGILAGDFNSIIADLSFEGWRTLTQRGLDRMFITKDGRLHFERIHHGAKTGVGGDMQHESVIGEFDVRVAVAEGG